MDDGITKLVNPLLQELDRELGQSYAAVLYGSGARGEYRPGLSDINLLLVCEALSPETLRRLHPSFAQLRAQRHAPPLLLARDEWARAEDVFPIEVTDMQLAHETLRGSDPVSGMQVDRADLRRALEQEFRAKLLRLRQAFALHSADPAVLGEIAARTVASVAALFRVALALHGRSVPLATPDMLTAAGAAMGVTIAPVSELWQARQAKPVPASAAMFEGYLAAVASTVRVIDQFTGGGN